MFGAFESSKNAEYKVFLNAASLSNVVYAHTFDAEVAKELKAAVPSVTVHKTFDGGECTVRSYLYVPRLMDYFGNTSLNDYNNL